MFECSAAAERVIGNVEQMIGFVVRQFEFQYLYSIEGTNKSAGNSDLMDKCEPTVSDRFCFFGDFELKGGVGQLGCSEGGVNPVGSEVNLLLVLSEQFVYILFHLKSFLMAFGIDTIFGIPC